MFDIFTSYRGTVITVPYIKGTKTKKSTHRSASIFSYYWEFRTVMNSASTSRVVSGFRKE